MINTNLVYTSIFTFGIVLLLTILFPNLDIDFSKLFYDSNNGFIYRNNNIVLLLFEVIPILSKLLTIVILLYLLYLIVKYKTFNRLIISWSFYIILSTAVGPGLLVNYILDFFRN